MTRKQVQKDGTPVFDLTLRYESTYFDYFDPQYGGNISEILWSRDEPYSYGYAFDYDAHSRVTDALYMYDENNIPGCCSEEGITYDKNGNLLTLYRYDDNGEIADIRNTYSGNHLTGNTYDAAGNVTYDRSSGLSYQWNHLNLIKNISEPDMCLVNYSYLADVTKFSALDEEGRGLEYHGSLTFRKVGASRQVESREFSCGSIYIMLGTSTPFVPFYHVKDYLGSVRAVVDGRSGEVVEANDYYAFGSRWETISSSGTISNRYRFNGKEDQEGEFGVPTLDYGARHYSATSARWLSMDPLAEKYYSVSPYVFCNNNPVNFVDPDGERLYFAKDVSDKFKKQFAETIKFMNSKGTSGDIARLHSSETVYYIGEASRGKEHWNHFNLHTRTILWDPNTIYESPENMFVSPATTLAHEVSHALRYDTAMNSDDPDVKANYIRALQSDSANKYGSQEEEIVITTTEQSAARKHGEIRKDQVTRKGHTSGKLISIGSDMSPEDLSKSIFEHNNLF